MKQWQMNIVKKFLYLKLCWQRAYSHIGVVGMIVQIVLTTSVFLKVIVGYFSIVLCVGLAVGSLIMLTIVGHMDLSMKVCNAEVSLGNRYNPELKYIYRKVKHHVKK